MTTSESRLNLLLLALTVPIIAQAEPVASMSHLPFLWLIAVVIAALSTWILIKLAKRSSYLKTPVRRWSLGIVLFAFFLLFVSPIIVGIGSILITGRTM